MNKVILTGRLTRDPELRYTNSGASVCNFTIAVDRPYSAENGGKKEADFIEIITWNKIAENVAKYMTKGRQVAVEGRLQIRSYDKDGQKHWRTEVVAASVEFLGSASNGGSGQPGGNNGVVAKAGTPQEMGFSDEDLPF